MKKFLSETTSYRFENIIKDLLSAMGYDDVTVTSPTNDKGVDVTVDAGTFHWHLLLSMSERKPMHFFKFRGYNTILGFKSIAILT